MPVLIAQAECNPSCAIYCEVFDAVGVCRFRASGWEEPVTAQRSQPPSPMLQFERLGTCDLALIGELVASMLSDVQLKSNVNLANMTVARPI